MIVYHKWEKRFEPDSPHTKNGGNATEYKALGTPNIVIKAFEPNEREKME